MQFFGIRSAKMAGFKTADAMDKAHGRSCRLTLIRKEPRKQALVRRLLACMKRYPLLALVHASSMHAYATLCLINFDNILYSTFGFRSFLYAAMYTRMCQRGCNDFCRNHIRPGYHGLQRGGQRLPSGTR